MRSTGNPKLVRAMTPSRLVSISTGALVTLLLVSCSAKVLVPPNLDLVEMERFGVVTFTSEQAAGSLNDLATEYFGDELLAIRPDAELVELGELSELLNRIERDRLDRGAVRALGKEYDVPAIFGGNIEVATVDPRSWLSESVDTEDMLTVHLTVTMISSESGNAMWRGSATATETVGAFEIVDGNIRLTADDPDEAYGHIIEHLVYEITKDFRPGYM
ncbi:MAG: hypothetical protein ACE5HT_14255 [Gemmatimonadales bacterium]